MSLDSLNIVSLTVASFKNTTMTLSEEYLYLSLLIRRGEILSLVHYTSESRRHITERSTRHPASQIPWKY